MAEYPEYLEVYSHTFSKFINTEYLHMRVLNLENSYNVTEAEITGKVINVSLEYLNQIHWPSRLKAYLIHQVIQEIKSLCKNQPEGCGFIPRKKRYASAELTKAIIGKVKEICVRYSDDSRLALLPPPSATPFPLCEADGIKNRRRKMEDRHVVVHDLNTMFGIQDDYVANYYAVFDGHSGKDAAVYCATHLHQYLAESTYYPTNPDRALRHAFLATDARYARKWRFDGLCGGTTAVCTLIRNNRLHVAWVGDSVAILVKRDSVVQLVNPHRLDREDEVQRIQEAGGVVMETMGTLRVNGVLSVTRAIGDYRYRPSVISEPEIKSIPLDGTEDFLILATDGLTDHLKLEEIVFIVYHDVQRSQLPNVQESLFHAAKLAGSGDNITVIVVFLTPVSEIKARPYNTHPLCRNLKMSEIYDRICSKNKPPVLNYDDADNATNSNILKQSMLSQEQHDHENDGILTARNGKHENGDADYDYSDLGPETDVDAIDDVATTMPVKNLSYEFYKNSDPAHHIEQPDKELVVLDNVEIDESTDANIKHDNSHENDADDDNDNDEIHKDEAAVPKTVHDDIPENICNVIREEMDTKVHESCGESIDDEEMLVKRNDRVEDAQDVVDEAGPVDFDDSPPSPQANKPQHALIHEADNVADSEDSEDEWNYYRVDPNKEKDSAAPVDRLQVTRNEEESKNLETPDDDSESKIRFEGLEEDIKCESPKEEQSELINKEISAEDKTVELEKEETPCTEEQQEPKDMDFQLNPNAAEFIPVSPQFAGTTMNLAEDDYPISESSFKQVPQNLAGDDYPVSGSPFKQVPQMDDIQVPSQSEFEKEVCQRPREVETEDEEKEYQNGGDSLQRDDYTDFMSDSQKLTTSGPGNLDDSEISSTKAEFGDESTASFLTASEFHRTANISTIDESFSSSERDYDIAKDPMAMSFTPRDFEAAFDKGVDLNAVHNLSNTDLDDKNGSMEKEEEEEDLMAESFNLKVDSSNLMTTSDAEEPEDKAALPQSPAKLANLPLQQEESEDTFIEHPDKTGTEVSSTDLLNLQEETESSHVEQQEAARDDRSPMTENLLAEYESEKEPVSIDNEEAPLSPSSADIDETKPLDEASEDAAIPESDSQKEVCPNKADTPLSLSPVPDAMESDLNLVASAKENAELEMQQSSIPIQSSLHPDAPEFLPRQYNSDFPSFGAESSEDGQQLSPAETSSEKVIDSYQPLTVEISKEVEEVKQDTTADVNMKFEEKKESDEPELQKSQIQSSLDFFKEEENVCARTPYIHSELTPPLSPREVTEKVIKEDICLVERKPEEEVPEETIDDMIVVMEDKVEKTPESVKEQLVEVAEPVVEPETIESTDQQPTLKLSDSMQEFTGLEHQLQPSKEEEPPVLTSIDKEQDQEEIVKKEELEELVIKTEDVTKIEEPVKSVEEIEEVVEACKIEEKEKIEELISNIEEESEVKVVETEKLEVKEPEIKEEVETKEPEVKEPEIKEVEVHKSEIKEVEIHESEVREPEIKEVEVHESEVREPEIKEVEVHESEAREPEIKEVEVHKSEVKEPEIKEVEARESEVKEPEIKEIEVHKSEIKESEIKEVEVHKSEVVKPEIQGESEVKEPEVKKPEEEKVVEIPENKIAEVAAAAATGASIGQTKAKVKATAAAKPPKTTTSSKAVASKSTPTSPSKTAAASATRTSTVATKKPSTTTTATRPKDLEAPKKATVPSTATSKPPIQKSTLKTTTTTTTSATTKPTARMSLGTASKVTKSTPTAPSKQQTVVDKKAANANGEVKSSSGKPVAAKPPSKTLPATKSTTLVKTSTTPRMSSGTTKPRPASVGTTSKPSATSKSNNISTTTTTTTSNTNVSNARPKTAPAVGSATKTRMSSLKSPIIDKQVKETANKQISMGKTSNSASKTTNRLSSSNSTTTTTVRRLSSTTKTTSPASAINKKSTTKVSKTSTSVGKTATTTTTEKGKIMQNGVSEKVEVSSTIIEDVPKKDLSPLVAPNDNQLIMSTD